MSDPHQPSAGAGDDTSLRLAGFGLTALGGMLIGVGALMPWIRTSLEGIPDAYSPTYYGIDLPDGLVVLAAAVVVLGGLAITRLAPSPRARRAAAGAVVTASFVALAIAGAAIVSAASRFEPTAVGAAQQRLTLHAQGSVPRVVVQLQGRGVDPTTTSETAALPRWCGSERLASPPGWRSKQPGSAIRCSALWSSPAMPGRARRRRHRRAASRQT